MHAALVTARHTVELIEFDEPTPADTGVVVDIAYCGICGTDVHSFESTAPVNPATCGHEWVGTVSAAGRSVDSVAEGDRVVIAVPPACGSCEPCRAGHTRWCTTTFLHLVGRDPLAPPHGGFAPAIAVGEGRVMRANAELSDEQAAQVEPATICFHGVRSSHVRPGDTTVVQGAGPIGLLTLQFARVAGAGHTIVIEPNPDRRALAAAVGASAVVEPGEAATQAVADATRGLGADIVFECAGLPHVIQTASDFARRGGALALIGFTTESARIQPATWMIKELSVTASLGYTHDEFERCMGLIADGRIDVDSLHTDTIGLDDVGAALADLASGGTTRTKVLVDPRQ
ncbi:MAG: zinc-binding dehydrogenase [Acidimicrobiia bacterium]|nr:zinc-binding dehydrogenase [Acidimicrobiia bacterium]